MLPQHLTQPTLTVCLSTRKDLQLLNAMLPIRIQCSNLQAGLNENSVVIVPWLADKLRREQTLSKAITRRAKVCIDSKRIMHSHISFKVLECSLVMVGVYFRSTSRRSGLVTQLILETFGVSRRGIKSLCFMLGIRLAGAFIATLSFLFQ